MPLQACSPHIITKALIWKFVIIISHASDSRFYSRPSTKFDIIGVIMLTLVMINYNISSMLISALNVGDTGVYVFPVIFKLNLATVLAY